MIALALSCRPALLLADEPTTALDATVQIQILLLLRSLQRELGMATIFVTHDIGVACEVADRIAVMYAGRFVETGPVGEIISRPAHPYTAGLLSSTVPTDKRGERLASIPGYPPDLADLPPGCGFGPRCRYHQNDCDMAVPEPRPVAGSNFTIQADCLIKAIGQQKTSIATLLGLKTERGFIKVDTTLRTSVPRVFAGGDCIRAKGAASTVMAAQDGKIAAAGIHTALSATSPCVEAPHG